MLRWLFKFLFVLSFYGGAMSFGRNFALATGRTPSTWSDWDMYSVILIAFVTAFFDFRRFL
jgi:hypothetical protein